jgi:hypothetical protein
MVEAILDWWQPEGVTLPELSMPFPTIWFEQQYRLVGRRWMYLIAKRSFVWNIM